MLNILTISSLWFYRLSPGWLVDITDNYGSAFYSCAVGMGLGAVCLALVGPAKSRSGRRRDEGAGNQGDQTRSPPSRPDEDQDLEVDLAPEGLGQEKPPNEGVIGAGPHNL